MLIANRWFAAGKEAGSRNEPGGGKGGSICGRQRQLEQRVRVLEQIVTDSGAETAAQIEALREQPRIAKRGRKAPTIRARLTQCRAQTHFNLSNGRAR